MILSRVTQSTLFRELTTSVTRLQQQIADAQSEVSTQKKLQDPSDDPAGTAAANRLTGELSALATATGVARAASRAALSSAFEVHASAASADSGVVEMLSLTHTTPHARRGAGSGIC